MEILTPSAANHRRMYSFSMVIRYVATLAQGGVFVAAQEIVPVIQGRRSLAHDWAIIARNGMTIAQDRMAIA